MNRLWGKRVSQSISSHRFVNWVAVVQTMALSRHHWAHNNRLRLRNRHQMRTSRPSWTTFSASARRHRASITLQFWVSVKMLKAAVKWWTKVHCKVVANKDNCSLCVQHQAVESSFWFLIIFFFKFIFFLLWKIRFKGKNYFLSNHHRLWDKLTRKIFL